MACKTRIHNFWPEFIWCDASYSLQALFFSVCAFFLTCRLEFVCNNSGLDDMLIQRSCYGNVCIWTWEQERRRISWAHVFHISQLLPFSYMKQDFFPFSNTVEKHTEHAKQKNESRMVREEEWRRKWEIRAAVAQQNRTWTVQTGLNLNKLLWFWHAE